MQQQRCDHIVWGIIFSQRVNLKLALRFYALLIVTILLMPSKKFKFVGSEQKGLTRPTMHNFILSRKLQLKFSFVLKMQELS